MGERNASPPRATQNVLFSSAPAATSGRSSVTGSGSARGRVAARAAQREPRADDGVLAAAVDRPVVCEEHVGDSAEPLPRLLVVEGDRLVGAVAARHDERNADVGAEQVVQRRVREHQPRATASRARPRAAIAEPSPPAHEHDRARRRAEQLALLAASRSASAAGSAAHHGERLLLAVLALTQASDRVLVGRVAGEVAAAEALHRDDRAVAERRDRLLERQRELRPAGGARDRLGVEATVGGVLVLASAVGAEREAGHRRVRPVVRDRV